MVGVMRLSRLALAGAGLLALGAAARAEEGVAVKSLLGTMGIIPKEREQIIYRERAPLVLPPKMDLRPPVEGESVQAKNPQWPNDPDVLARKRKEAEARTPVTESETRRMSDNNPRLSIDEIRAGRRPGAGIPTAPVVRHGDNSRDEHWVDPRVLRSQKQAEQTVEEAGIEPSRSRLVDPPSGLRASANGKPIQRNFEPVRNRNDEEADPKVYLREQAKR